jgi:hypothetical protein
LTFSNFSTMGPLERASEKRDGGLDQWEPGIEISHMQQKMATYGNKVPKFSNIILNTLQVCNFYWNELRVIHGMTAVVVLVILPHVGSDFLLESCSCITMFCRVLCIIIIISIVIFFKLNVIFLRMEVRCIINSNEIVQNSKSRHNLRLYKQRVFWSQHENAESPLEEAEDVLYIVPQLRVSIIE